MRASIPLLALLMIAVPFGQATSHIPVDDESEFKCPLGICYKIEDVRPIMPVVAVLPTGSPIAYVEIELETGFLEIADLTGSRVFLASAYGAPDWSALLNQPGPVKTEYTLQATLGDVYGVPGPVQDQIGTLWEQRLTIYDNLGPIAFVPLATVVLDPMASPLPATPSLEEITTFVF